MCNKLKAFKWIVLLKYHHELSGCGLSWRRCTAAWIALRGTIWVVPTARRGSPRQLPSCTGCIGGSCLASTITIPAVWCISPVANVWTTAMSPSTLDWASWTTKRHFDHAGMPLAVDLKWLSGLVPTQGRMVSFLSGLCFLHLVDPVQRTIWTACSSHWKDFSGIATALYRMHFSLLRWLK